METPLRGFGSPELAPLSTGLAAFALGAREPFGEPGSHNRPAVLPINRSAISSRGGEPGQATCVLPSSELGVAPALAAFSAGSMATLARFCSLILLSSA
jgi:hypothetical protein